jgi:hypothetical protein
MIGVSFSWFVVNCSMRERKLSQTCASLPPGVCSIADFKGPENMLVVFSP